MIEWPNDYFTSCIPYILRSILVIVYQRNDIFELGILSIILKYGEIGRVFGEIFEFKVWRVLEAGVLS